MGGAGPRRPGALSRPGCAAAAWARLRPAGSAALAWLPGERSVKTALAAGLAWAVGSALGNPRPYFAPLAAILVLQVTIAESVARAVQRVLGVVVGVALALLVGRLVGLTALGIALLVLLSLAVGSRLRLGLQGVPQVAVSALLVLIIGSLTRANYALERMSETLLGACVAVGVNALIVPPSYVPRARRALQALAQAQGALLRGLAADWRAGWAPAAAGARLAEARELGAGWARAAASVAMAAESLRFNPFGRRERALLARLQAVLPVLERSGIAARGIVRTLHDCAPATPPAGPVPDLTAALGAALEAFAAAAPGGGPQAFAPARADAERLLARARGSGACPAEWVWLGAVLTDAARLLADLDAALAGLPA